MTTRQIRFDDVVIGSELPPLAWEVSYDDLVAYAAASRDHYAIHLNPDIARAAGLPDVIIHGALKAALLGRLLTRWMGEWGTLKSLDVEFREIDVVGRLTARGTVTGTQERGRQFLVDCKVWIENASGSRTTIGRAVVALPKCRFRVEKVLE